MRRSVVAGGAPGNLATIPTLTGSNLTKGFSNGANPHQPSHSYNLLNQTSRSDNHSRSRTRPIRLYGGILKNNSSPLLAAGGTSDHVHLLVSLSKNIALSILLKDVKKDSRRGSRRREKSSKTFIGRMAMEHFQLASPRFQA